ncbi:MAG: membrane protein insertase YidC [Verrucomicrobiota bacterium]
MDRTSWIGVIVCIALFFAWTSWRNQQVNEERRAAAEEAAKQEPAAPPVDSTSGAEGMVMEGDSAPEQPLPEPPKEVQEKLFSLQTPQTEFVFTDKGGGIRAATLFDHESSHDKEEKVILNEYAAFPVGALSRGVGNVERTRYTTARSEQSIVFEGRTEDGLQVKKTYTPGMEGELASGYTVGLKLELTNADPEKAFTSSDLYLSVGSAAPEFDGEQTYQRGLLYFYKGKAKMVKVDKYKKEQDPKELEMLLWAGVNNQFFHTNISAAEPYDGKVWGSRESVSLNEGEIPAEKIGGPEGTAYAVIGALGLPKISLAPGESTTLDYRIYMGPKEYAKLKGLGRGIDAAMRYDDLPVLGWLAAPFSRILMGMLTWIHGWAQNYGIAILVITLIIRIVIWPLHHKAQRSMKRMAKLSPMMTEIREKHKEDPQKMNTEMMALYKDYGVNPFGGCLPMLAQMPIFLGFFQMLRSAAELRHESGGPAFWVDDLSMPDTVASPLGIPINPLPIVMGVTMFLQMKMTPQTGDKTQQRIFMFMPIIFLFICYNFASALALYWTAQNIISIGQTWLMRKIPEPELKKKPRQPAPSMRQNPMSPYDKPKKPKKQTPRTGGGGGKKKRK